MNATPDDMGPGTDLKRAVTVAHKLLDDLVSTDMSGLGLSVGEADLLTVILVAEHVPTPTEIAEWLSLTTAGATGRLNTLERKGLIERRPHASDGRRLTVHLSEKGAQLADDVLQTKDRAMITHVVDRLGPDRTHALVEELNTLIAIVSATLDDQSFAKRSDRSG